MSYPNNFAEHLVVNPLFNEIKEMWRKDGKSLADLETAIDNTRTSSAYVPVSLSNKQIEADQLLAFAYSDRKYHALLAKHHFPLPGSANDYNPTTTADLKFRQRVDAQVKISLKNVAQLEGDRRTKALVQELMAWIRKIYTPKQECTLTSSAWEAIQGQCGVCVEHTNIQHHVFAQAGLTPVRLHVTQHTPTIQNFHDYFDELETTGWPVSHVITGIPLADGSMLQVDGTLDQFTTSYKAHHQSLFEAARNHLFKQSLELLSVNPPRSEDASARQLRMSAMTDQAVGMFVELIQKCTSGNVSTTVARNTIRTRFEGYEYQQLILTLFDLAIGGASEERIVAVNNAIEGLPPRTVDFYLSSIANIALYALQNPTLSMAVHSLHIEHNPNYINAAVSLLYIAVITRQPDIAINTFGRLAQNHPEYAMFHYLLSKSYAIKSRTAHMASQKAEYVTRTLASASRAVSIDPKSVHGALHLSDTLLATGAVDKAKKELERVGALFPDDQAINLSKRFLELAPLKDFHRVIERTHHEVGDFISNGYTPRSIGFFMAKCGQIFTGGAKRFDVLMSDSTRDSLVEHGTATLRLLARNGIYNSGTAALAILTAHAQALAGNRNQQIRILQEQKRHNMEHFARALQERYEARIAFSSQTGTPFGSPAYYKEFLAEHSALQRIDGLSLLPGKVRYRAWTILLEHSVKFGKLADARKQLRSLEQLADEASGKRKTLTRRALMQAVIKPAFSSAASTATSSLEERVLHARTAFRGLKLVREFSIGEDRSLQREWVGHIEAIHNLFKELQSTKDARLAARELRTWRKRWRLDK